MEWYFSIHHTEAFRIPSICPATSGQVDARRVVNWNRVKRLALVLYMVPALAQVHFTRTGEGAINVEVDGKPFTTLHLGEDSNKPYLAPLRAASGTMVTRGYPMEMIKGESRDHPHHRGVFFSHGDVNQTNFWDDSISPKNPNRGRIVPVGRIETTSTGNTGKIVAHFNWIAHDGKPILREDRTMTFYSGTGKDRIIDFDINLHAIQRSVFGDTKEGTFAIRLADALSEERGGTMTNAQGATTMKNVWGKPSPWVDYSGVINGEKVGVTVFDHPQNPRHPTTWHVRDYGLFAANIFGQHDFENPAMPNGSMTLERGQDLRFRYRVLIHAGGTDRGELEKEYKKYAGEK